jgi:rod shape-determining protein MreC
MLRALLTRKPDWTVFTAACVLSIVLMLLPGGAQVRVAWFLQHIVLAPVEASVNAVEGLVSVHWENQKLRKRLAELRMEADALRAEREENLRLKRLLDLRGEAPRDLVAARVVGRSLDRLGGSLTIDKGTDDGIGPDVAVLTPEGLVGRVERAAPRWSRVLTLLHRDCAVAVRLERSRVQGVVQWQFGDRPQLDLLYVSSQEDVKPGDVVATSGMGGLFPEGIRVGTVARVGLAEDRLMKSVTIEPSVSFQRLGEVLVFLPGAKGVFPREAYAPPAAADTTGAGPAPEAGNGAAPAVPGTGP